MKVKDKINIKKFRFDGMDELREEISICIYETVEKLISEYYKEIIIKIDKVMSIKKIYFLRLRTKIDIQEKQLIKHYFKNALSEDIITISVLYS